MRVFKYNASLNCLFRCYRLWCLFASGAATPARMLMRKKLSTRVEIFSQVPIYLVKCNHDLLSGWSLIEASLNILKTESPFWMDRMRKYVKSITTTDLGSISRFCLPDRCCFVNPWKMPPYSDTARATYFAAYIVGTLCTAILLDGRFGYFGMRHRQWLSLKSEIRFLQRCISSENYQEVLTAMGLCYKLADQMRPGRNYHHFFMQHQVRKWRKAVRDGY